MIRVQVTSLTPGMEIASSVFDEEGNLLLGRDMVLNSFLIQRLKIKGVTSVFIKEEGTDDIIPRSSISDRVRGSTIRELRELTSSLNAIRHEMKRFSLFAVADVIGSPRFKSVYGDNPVLKNIREAAAGIVDELLTEEVSLGLSSMKTYDNYLFEHSIDVAVYAIMLGRKLRLDEKRLRELGTGCLLHDIGMTFIPKEIVNKQGPLTREEMAEIRLHPEIGYELFKDVAQIGVLPPHIAFQHHERQDGSGYPRGMTGDPKIEFGEKPRQIHLYASICAIADVYDALASDRPHRPAYSTETVLELMVGMSGTHLHEKLLNEFLSYAPPFPVASSVKIIAGEYTGYIGLVKTLNSRDLKRPVIRLVFDDHKKRITPIEIDLYIRPGIVIESTAL